LHYASRTVTVRWEGEQRELGTLDCPEDPTADGAEAAFLAEAIRVVEPCFKALPGDIPPQARFLMVIRGLVRAYIQEGRDEALEDRLATFYMRMYWEAWCKLMDPDGRLGTPPPAPSRN
jgi:hypothetical protein